MASEEITIDWKRLKRIALDVLELAFFMAASALSIYILYDGEALSSLVDYYNATKGLLQFLVFIPIISITLRYLERYSSLRVFATDRAWVSVTVLFTIIALSWHAAMVANGWYWDLGTTSAGRALIPLHFLFALAFASILLNFDMQTSFRNRAIIFVAVVVAGLNGYDNWNNLVHISSIGRPASDLGNALADPVMDVAGNLLAVSLYIRLVRRKHVLEKALPAEPPSTVSKAKTRPY